MKGEVTIQGRFSYGNILGCWIKLFVGECDDSLNVVSFQGVYYCSVYALSICSLNVLNTKVAKTVSLKKVVYWQRLCFPPFFRQQLHLLRPNKWPPVRLTYGLSRTQALYDYHFFKWIHSWCHFSPLLNSFDMIVPRLFRQKFFFQRGTPPTNFHGTIRCDVNSFL